jgi:hypothetical protein
MSGAVELMRRRLAERRELLEAHNPAAIDVAAAALAALHGALSRHAASVRCDRQARFRLMQLMGERALPLEDMVSIAHETPVGKAAVLAALRVIVNSLGQDLEPVVDDQRAIDDAVAAIQRHGGAVGADYTVAKADGHVSDEELLGMAPAVAELKAGLAQLEGRIAKARSKGRA